MDRRSLRQFLDAEGVSRDAYSLHPEPTRDETYCLKAECGGWAIYYSERGLRSNEEHVETEDEACRLLLDRLLRDPTTRHSA